MKKNPTYLYVPYRHLLVLICLTFGLSVSAQQKQKNIVIANATAHLGNGTVIPKSLVVIQGKFILLVSAINSATYQITGEDSVIHAEGMHLYPGLINPNNILGLHDAEAVRATRDFSDVGEMNPHLRTCIAYNTDNAIVPTVKTNGILYTQVCPRGGIISGSSGVMALEAWNWEDAALLADDGIHLNFPKKQISVMGDDESPEKNPNKKYEEEKDRLFTFFTQAKAYASAETVTKKNIRFEAMRGVFNGSTILYVHADKQKEILAALQFVRQFGIPKTVMVGAKEAYKVTSELKAQHVPVMLNRVNDLPDNTDDDVDLMYRLPYLLQKDSVLFCLQLEGDMEAMQSRNLPFNAGHAVAYGLTEEQALSAITLNAAKIMGLDSSIGTLEPGKLASVVLSRGNILDMRSNDVVFACIAGKPIALSNKQTDLYNTYKKKYKLK